MTTTTHEAHVDHPYSDPGDGRSECETCGKWVWPFLHSCKGIRVTPTTHEVGAMSERVGGAVERVRDYLVTRDGFYGREAGDDDVLDSAYVGSGYEGAVPLLLSDLRLLVGAPSPEAYDDRLDTTHPTPDARTGDAGTSGGGRDE